MAGKNPISDIHLDLLSVLITGYISQNEKTDTYVRWTMRFQKYCDETAVIKGPLMGHMEHLEKKKTLFPGIYDTLAEMLEDDSLALKKIKEAIDKIETIGSIAKSSKSKNKDEMKPFVKFEVEIKNGENVVLKKMTTLLHSLIIGLKTDYSIEDSWIDKGYLITNEKGTDRIYAKSLGTVMHNVEESLAKLLSKKRNDSTEKSKEILEIYFALLHSLKTDIGMTTVEIGWDHSIIILLKTQGEYEGDASDKYESLKAKVKSCFEDMFCLKVSVAIKNLTAYDAENLIKKLNERSVNEKHKGMT